METKVTSPTRTFTLAAVSTHSTHISNDLRINFSRYDSIDDRMVRARDGSVPVERSMYVPGYSGENAGGTINFSLNGITASQNPFPPFGAATGQFQVVDNVTLVSGNHLFKIGGDYRRLLPEFTPLAYSSTINVTSEVNVLAGIASSYQIIARQSLFPILENYSFYVQDAWRPTPRINVDLGVRWDVNPAPGEHRHRSGNCDWDPRHRCFRSNACSFRIAPV
jgi:outer membrane receptor protein involved in Fe transport